MKYCEDCKWLGEDLSNHGKCLRVVTTAVHREKSLWKDAIDERNSGAEDACGASGKHWEEYIPPRGFWQKLLHELKYGGA